MIKEKLFSITKKDLEIQTFKSGGKGGQHQNTCDSGVRIIHYKSGATGESRTERSQKQNKRNALKRLVNSEKFKLWLQRVLFELNHDEKEIENQIDILMREENLKIEIYENGKWIQK